MVAPEAETLESSLDANTCRYLIHVVSHGALADAIRFVLAESV